MRVQNNITYGHELCQGRVMLHRGATAVAAAMSRGAARSAFTMGIGAAAENLRGSSSEIIMQLVCMCGNYLLPLATSPP